MPGGGAPWAAPAGGVPPGTACEAAAACACGTAAFVDAVSFVLLTTALAPKAMAPIAAALARPVMIFLGVGLRRAGAGTCAGVGSSV
jgi:hypothetical protein